MIRVRLRPSFVKTVFIDLENCSLASLKRKSNYLANRSFK